ncbi:MotA/TolQ/ExbB proton channel family protein [Mesorhizobium sp. AR10]|uniref:MotA/TolQ/ExbB proton channel family protein n=1 Tax=Mesorhizobium sp. AR10 TaxID=2865839 RepID=UPI00215DF4D5|nr:MotA/TolQ/ExbB proton channel family protein [Mesorhizobium sp. AR10]UVK40704.1 MotA/TolQ/ExbB proton channel family protein [Mesorhizobium sp. AR10]
MVDIYSRESVLQHKSRPGIVPIGQKLWPEQAVDLGSHTVARRLSDTHSDHGAPLAFLSRFIVLQAIGVAGIVGLWVAGIASKPFAGDNAFLCWFIAAIGALGILCVFLRRWRDVDWLATHVVRIGLLGTVVGLIVAFSAARAGGSADPNAIRPMIASVIDGMYVALYATLLGIATNLWLKINLRLLGNFDG